MSESESPEPSSLFKLIVDEAVTVSYREAFTKFAREFKSPPLPMSWSLADDLHPIESKSSIAIIPPTDLFAAKLVAAEVAIGAELHDEVVIKLAITMAIASMIDGRVPLEIEFLGKERCVLKIHDDVTELRMLDWSIFQSEKEGIARQEAIEQLIAESVIFIVDQMSGEHHDLRRFKAEPRLVGFDPRGAGKISGGPFAVDAPSHFWTPGPAPEFVLPKFEPPTSSPGVRDRDSGSKASKRKGRGRSKR